MNALMFDKVVKTYKRRRALDELNLEVPSGSVFGLVGSNGAGKTTSLCLAAGILKARSGKVDILGAGPFNPPTHAGRVSLLPQDASLPLHARVTDVLRYLGRLQGIGRDKIDGEIQRVLEWVNLTDRSWSRLRTLSHGMRRRVAIAQAFMGSPELILLDEPLSGLDPREVVKIRSLIADRRGEQTIIVSSHLLNEIEVACDHVAFMEQGKRQRQDTVNALVNQDSVLRYVVREVPKDLQEIRDALNDFIIDVDREHQVLTVRSGSSTVSPDEINTRVLPVLLRHGIGILEVSRGHKLEAAYLKTRTE